MIVWKGGCIGIKMKITGMQQRWKEQKGSFRKEEKSNGSVEFRRFKV